MLHTGDGCVDGNLAIEEKALVPAFELDMSSVIFASTASAATTTGALSINEAFTLRYGMDRKVSALVSYDKSKVTLSGVWPGIKLVVQNKDGANAKLIMMQKEVSATDMGVDTFANCKVWLEYTNDSERKTYATLATEEQGYDVNITASDGLTVTNGVQGVVQGSAITDITVAVADGYYLPNGYTNNIQGLNGLNVKDVTQTGFTISGTPTNDVNIVLEARRDQFVVEGGEKDVDYTYQNGILTFVKDGDYVLKHPSGIIDTSDRVVIANNFNGSLTLDNISINLGGVPCIDVASDANLKLIIRGKNTLGVHSHDPAAIQFMNVAENGSLTIDSEEPVGELNLHGCNGPGLGSPGYSDAYTKNIYIDGGIIDASSAYCSAIGSHNDKNPSEITINGGVVKGGKIGSRDVSSNTGSKVIINGGYIQNNINVEAEINGGFVTGIIEDKEIKNSKGEIVYKTDITLESNSVKSLKVDGKDYNFPTQSGIDKISVYLPQGEHILTQEDYDGNTYEYKVIIGNDGTVKHVNAWEIDLTINGWTYGQNANEPSAKSKFGGVVFSYSDKKDGNYTNIVPSNAGTYYVKATVAETENYTGLESAPVPFEIKKANSSIKFKDGISFNKVYDTDTVVVKEEQIEKTGSTGTVSFTFEKKVNDEWKNVETPTEAGKYRVTATLAGDNNHIPATSKPLEFTISKANSTVTITTQSLNKAYDGKVVATPEYEKTGSDGKVTVKWQKNTGTNENPKWEDLKSAPSTVGTYRVVVELAENDSYTSASATKEFTISKADNAWTEELSITDWIYNEKENVPTAKAQYGKVTFTYSAEKNGTYTNEVPKNAGTYYVKATVVGTENYTNLESVKSFKIAKAETILAFERENIDKTYDKNAISEPMVTKKGSGKDTVFEWYIANGSDWKKLDSAPTDVGKYKVVASVKEDTNHNGTSIEKKFSISMADNKWTNGLSIKDWTYGEDASFPSAEAKYGDVVYIYSDSEDGAYTSDLPVNAGTWYVKASVAGTTNYTGLESAPVPFEIKKANSSIKFKDGISFNKVYDTDTVVVKEEQIEKTGSTGTVSFTFEKKVNDEWKNVETPTEAGKYRVTATLAGDNNHIPATSKPLEFTISKANSTVTITTQSLNKAYDGKVVATPEYEKTGSDGKVTVKWQKNTGTNENPKWEDLKSAPTNVGKYKVVVTLDGNGNYNSASKELEFTISKTTENTWTEKLSIKGWTYKEQANKPSAKVKFGTVTYTYSDKENGTYTSDVPSNAGTYYVKATVAGNENYTGLESVVPFEIKKADPVLKALNTLTIEEGKTLKSLSLPEGYKWKNPDYVCKDLGTYTYKAVYTPKDSVNYNVLDVEVSVKVIAKSIETSPVVTPSITNNSHNNNNTYVGNGGSTTSSVLNELNEVVNKGEYKAYKKAYTKESYDNYLDAFENAEKVLNNKNSSKEEIKIALDKLNEAILSLKVDKTKLESSLVEFEKLDADKYSEASYIKLKDALDKAKSVMEDKEASAEEIARAIDELNEAYSSLQTVEPTVTEPEKTSVGKLALITTVATVTVAGGSYLWILLKKSRGMK